MSHMAVGQLLPENFRVGSLVVTPGANEIGGVRVDAKAMEVLRALIDAAPSVLSPAALLDRVWPSVAVVDNVVHQSIGRLRKALGDDARTPRYIQNIPRRGYRLIAPITRDVPVVAHSSGEWKGDVRDKLRSSLPKSTGNLPVETNSFVGRDAEITELVELLRLHRLVTLTGVGGVGKTRLAVRVATQIAADFPDGLWFVELAPVGDPAAVPDAMATALAITPQSGRSATDAIAEALSGRRLLLLVDNCEHVLDAAADVVETLLARTTSIKVIATSREGLRVTAEHQWPVPSLDMRAGVDSSAVRLFIERAQAVRLGFHLSDSTEVDAVTNICQRLDGIALAIELAAARMVSMNPQELLTRLTDRFRLLSSSRHGLERHQTLRLAVQWSYDLLAKNERTLLGRCAVFAGGFDLASAAHICGGDDFDEYAVLDLLDSLVRKSLVTTDQVEGRTRYRLLETIRQFADEQLAATGEIEPVRGRHARYFAELAIVHWNIWDGPRQREAIDWCNAEFANLRAGFRWAVDRAALDTAAAIAAHTSMIVWVANLFEPAAWAEEILKAATAADLRQLPRLYAAAVYVLYTGRPEAAVNYAQTALRLTADARYDAFDPAWTEIRIASAQNATGADADTVLPVCTTLAARFGVARVLGITWMPQWLIDSGRDDEARAMAEEALDAAKTHGNPFVIAIALLNYGRAFAETDPDRAMSKLRQGLGYTHEHRTSFIEALTLENMAAVEGRLGNLHEALALFDSAIESFQRAGNLLALGNTLVVLAEFFRGGLQQLETASTILGGSRANAKWTRELPAVQERLRGVLGAQRFDECFAVGAAMEPAAALRYVRQQIQIARAKLFTVA